MCIYIYIHTFFLNAAEGLNSNIRRKTRVWDTSAQYSYAFQPKSKQAWVQCLSHRKGRSEGMSQASKGAVTLIMSIPPFSSLHCM